MHIKDIILDEPALAIAEYTQTGVKMAELRARLENVAYDVTTSKGLEIAKRDRAEVRDLRVALEKKRVELKAPALERSRLIDYEAKRLTAELEELERPIDQQIKIEESRKEAEKQARINAEFGRVQAIHEAIADIHMSARAMVKKPSAAIAAELETMKVATLDKRVYQEMIDQAKAAHRAAIDELELAYRAKLHDEAEAASRAAERAELEQLRKAATEQKAKDEAARAEQARLEALRFHAEQQAERDRAATERAAAQIEQKRLDAEAATARAEADALALAERNVAQAKHEAAMKAERDAAADIARVAADKAAKELAKKRKADAAEKKLRDAAGTMLSALQEVRPWAADFDNKTALTIIDTAINAAI